MNQDHLKTLAQDLKAAAQKYTQATGQRFDADFEFISIDYCGSDRATYTAGEVLVRAIDEVRA